jgi:3',5'-cyclic-AMP phosphodiesterase
VRARRFEKIAFSGNKTGRAAVWNRVTGSRRANRLPERMKTSMGDLVKENLDRDGIDRRGFLKCMAWAETGTLCLMQGGVLKSYAFGYAHSGDSSAMKGDFAFAQISDSHIGFDKAANPDVTATLEQAIAKLNGLPAPPDFVLYTGDLTPLSKASEFDTLDQSLKSVRTEKIFFLPDEHDVLNDNGEQYRARYGQGTFRASDDGRKSNREVGLEMP